MFDVVANCITIRRFFVGNRIDMAKALQFGARGAKKGDLEPQPLNVMDTVRRCLKIGQISSQMVLDLT